MNEFAAAARRMALDLSLVGVASRRRAGLVAAYRRALETRAPDDWIAFYAMIAHAVAGLEAVPARGRRAYDRLTALLHDDLGARLHQRIVEVA